MSVRGKKICPRITRMNAKYFALQLEKKTRLREEQSSRVFDPVDVTWAIYSIRIITAITNADVINAVVMLNGKGRTT